VQEGTFRIVPISYDQDGLITASGPIIRVPINPNDPEPEWSLLIQKLNQKIDGNPEYFKSVLDLYTFIRHILYQHRTKHIEKQMEKDLKDAIQYVRTKLGEEPKLTTHRRRGGGINGANERGDKTRIDVRLRAPTLFSVDKGEDRANPDLEVGRSKPYILIVVHAGLLDPFDPSKGFDPEESCVRYVANEAVDDSTRQSIGQYLLSGRVFQIALALALRDADFNLMLKDLCRTIHDLLKQQR
jgi:hypothetical protein